jgi:poly-gamma-glutamate synthesis protein (capsule biosynthesis protein)
MRRVTPEPLKTVAAEAPETPAASQPENSPTAGPTATATLPPATATPLPEPPRGSLGLAVGNGVAAAAGEQALAVLAAAGVQSERVSGEPDVLLQAGSAPGAMLAWERVFSPVDRMSSVLDSITAEELRGVWSGAAATPNFTNIYVPQSSLAELESVLGPASAAVKPTPDAAVADAVWGDKMGLGILPFEDLSPRLRAVGLNGATVTDNRFKAETWPLTARGWLAPVTERGTDALAKLEGQPLPITNRDPGKLTVLAMTGVTAMARNSAVAIERAKDYGFLAQQVGPELAAADITTTSNEIPFLEGCVPNNTLNNVLFCSKPEYYVNLEMSGIDAIGLTGNHLNDYGYDALRYTLQFYADKNVPTYGGGADEKTAPEPLILEHNGNRLAFIGANQFGPGGYWSATGEKVSAWAGPENPGAARFDPDKMSADIQALKAQADLVFAEVQHIEYNAAGDYQVEPVPQQEADFRRLSDAGADVVTGIMAHAPQAMELRPNGEILYGLGNLYFDQTWSWPTRTGLVARHAIYDGKLINTELLVTVIDKNFQLRWATPEERIQVLKSVFDASRW